MKKYYPEMNMTLIQELYGLDADTPETLTFNLSEFFERTRPTYQFVNCRLEFIDCRRLWQIKQSPMGYCLELDPGYVENQTFTIEQRAAGNSSPRDNFRTLGFTVGYNRSDATYGWNGYMNGLTVFYLNPIEKYQQEEHSYPLVPGLTPIIYVQNEEQNFLGKPYTECVHKGDYSVSFCQLNELIERIRTFCQCIPRYMANMTDFPMMNQTRDCTFRFCDHATCVALLRNNYKKIDGTCLPPCKYTSIHQETMHYTKLNSEHLDYIHKRLNISREIDLISTVIHIAEEAITIKEETATISISALFSSVGGAMGLVLGISLFNIVECSLKLSRMASNHVRAQQKKWSKCSNLAWRKKKRKRTSRRVVRRVVDDDDDDDHEAGYHMLGDETTKRKKKKGENGQITVTKKNVLNHLRNHEKNGIGVGRLDVKNERQNDEPKRRKYNFHATMI